MIAIVAVVVLPARIGLNRRAPSKGTQEDLSVRGKKSRSNKTNFRENGLQNAAIAAAGRDTLCCAPVRSAAQRTARTVRPTAHTINGSPGSRENARTIASVTCSRLVPSYRITFGWVMLTLYGCAGMITSPRGLCASQSRTYSG